MRAEACLKGDCMNEITTRTAPALLARCTSDDELDAWVRAHLELTIPRQPVCPNHHAPFEYLHHAYFEPAGDVVVWAPRGGGKTRLAAAATLLELLHKPGISIRILGGSLEQSLRVWEHLVGDLERLCPDELIRKRAGARRVELVNGSVAAVLAQSQRAVRGLRVQRLRCDEVENFDPAVWEAAQLVTRSRAGTGASIEALSTLHTPYGLMNRIVEQAGTTGTRVLRWCLLDVLEHCPPQRDCTTCALWNDCQGIAKDKCAGFFRIDDAIAMKQRVSLDTWESEMLCRRPSVQGCVFHRFDEAVHVRESLPGGRDELCLGIDFGFAAPFVCLWIERRADGVSFVIDEYVQPARTIAEHIEVIRARSWGTVGRVMCDPAGASRNEHTGTCSTAVLRAAGFAVRHRHSGILPGIEMMRTALRPGFGEPTLFIHPRCARLIRAMRCYHYAPGGSELFVKDGEHDHLIDALRYYFVNVSGTRAVQRRY